MAFKAKNHICNYFNKNKSKQKNGHSSTTNNTLIFDKETSRIVVDTFRKGTMRESACGLPKYKTSKNSPEHFSCKIDPPTEIRSLSNKHNENQPLNQINQSNLNYQPNYLLANTKIPLGIDMMFKRKINMIQNKSLKAHNSQLTYSNIYNNNSGKIKLDNSSYNKISKNESFVGKNNKNGLDDESLMHNYHNKMSSPRLIKAIAENDTSLGDYKYHLRAPSYNQISLKEVLLNNSNNNNNNINANHHNNNNNNDNSSTKMIYNQTKNHLYNHCKTGKRPSSSNASKHSSYKNNIKGNFNHNINLNAKCSSIISQLNGMHSISNPNFINEYKKMSKTSQVSKQNSRKNSNEKKQNNKENSNHPLNNPTSSAMKLKNYNELFNGKSSYSKRSASTLLKPKFDKEREINDIESNANDNELITQKQGLKQGSASNSNSNFASMNNSIQPKTGNNISNMNKIQFVEYVSSNMKNSSMKNSSISNRIIKKKEDDFLFSKLKAAKKTNKSLTAAHSKQNSKSNSRVEEYINSNLPPSSNKYNDETMMIAKNEKAFLMFSIINNKKSAVNSPIYQSPLGKSTQEIIKKINLQKSPSNLQVDNKKVQHFKYPDYFNKNQLSNELNNSNSLKLDDIKVNETEVNLLEKKLDESIDSIQSTARESCFYKKEMEKIATYIKKYYLYYQVYPVSRIQFYKIGRLLGRGAFGKVNLALHTCSGRLVAIKSFNKSKQTTRHSKKKIRNEIEVLQQLQHSYISQILDTFETNTHILIVMEYICGDLQSYIRKRAKLSETSSKIIFKQLIEGLQFIHQNNIVHRDIKLDNILFDLNNTVKICDFGVCKRLNPGEVMHNHCGTPAYIAPEIFKNTGYSGFGCDIWSAGVTLYHLMSGLQPFKANNLSKLHAKIIEGKFDKLEGVSIELKDLIDRLLQVDPKKRITIPEILSHPWLNSVNLKNKGNIVLFSNAELVLLTKFNVNYLHSAKEDLIENFTLRNIDTLKEEENMYGNTKSYILAPYNSYASLNDSLFSPEVHIVNNIWKFCGKVKQLNVKYELNNNKEFDNGMIITNNEEEQDKENNDMLNITSLSAHDSSKPISPPNEQEINIHNQIERDVANMYIQTEEYISNDKDKDVNEILLKDIEKHLGYKKSYVIDCLDKKEVNYATATYNLLNKETQEKNELN